MAWQFVRGWDWRWWTNWQSSRPQSSQTKTRILSSAFSQTSRESQQWTEAVQKDTDTFNLARHWVPIKVWRPRKACMLVPVRTKEKKPWGQLKIPAMALLLQNEKTAKAFWNPQDARLSIPGLLKKAFPWVLLSRRQEDQSLLQSWFRVVHLQLTVVRDLVTLKWAWFCWHAELTRVWRVQRKS